MYNYGPWYQACPPNDCELAGQTDAIPLETATTYKDFNGSTLRTVTKNFSGPYELLSDQTTQNNQVSETDYTYTFLSLPTERDDYDWGSGAKGPLLKKTVSSYFSYTDSLPYGVFDAVTKTQTFDGSGTLVAESDYNYDEQSSLTQTSGITAHDYANYPYTVVVGRRNLTSAIQCIVTSGSCAAGSPKMTFTYDDTGQVRSTIDPCGNAACTDMTGSNHTKTYSYADNYTVLSGGVNQAYSPGSPTNTFSTQVINPLGQTRSFSYDYNNGQLTASKDQNDINAARAGTTHLYNDAFARPTQINYPDNGQSSMCYTDVGGPSCSQSGPPFQLVTTRLATPDPTVTKTTSFDRFGRITQTKLSDPDCASGDKTDTTYDGLGRVYTVSNPYCVAGESTSGLTTYTYDALGRTTQVTHPDNSTILTTYAGRATQLQDEGNGNGTQRVTRISQVDGLGRLVSVCEVSSSSLIGSAGTPAPCGQDIPGTGFLTTYQYDTLSNLLQVNQAGINARTFAYDSLSRLTRTYNSESGTITYVYDLNGNLSTKTSPTPNLSTNPATGATAATGSGTLSGSEQSLVGAGTHSTGSITINSVTTPHSQSVTVGTYTCHLTLPTNVPASSAAGAVASCLNGHLVNAPPPTNNVVNLTSIATGSSTNYSISMSGFNGSHTGMSGGTDGTTTYDTGTVWITVNGVQTSASYGQSSTAGNLATALASAINGNSSLTVTASASSATVNLTAKSSGAATNYSLSSGSSTNQPGTFSTPSFAVSASGPALTGGTDYSTYTTTVSYQYDVLNRLTQKSYSDGTTPTATFVYDQGGCCDAVNLVGRLAESTVGTGNLTATYSSYDPMGRIALQSQRIAKGNGTSAGFTMPYTYDLMGNMTFGGLGWCGCNIGSNYTYNTAGRLTSLVYYTTTYLSGAHYDAAGRITSDTLGDGETEAWTYNKRGWPVSNTATLNSTNIYSYNITSFAPNGDILAANDSANGNWTYSYDPFNRLVGSNKNSGQAVYSYVYDRFGNRWQQNGPNTTQLTLTGNNPGSPQNNNRMDGYTYDAAGNLLNDGSHQYFYDAENHLIQVDGTLPYCTSNGASGTAATACYFYDANGHRVRSTATGICGAGGGLTGGIAYGYDLSGRLVMRGSTASNGGGGCDAEIYAVGRHLVYSTAGDKYSHVDWLGTERVRTLNGSICESIASLPFGDGQTITGSCYHDSTLHFTGKERDAETGLDNFGARFDASSFGRFMTPDPVGLALSRPSDSQSWNLYSYVLNNPLNRIDPDGLCSRDAQGNLHGDDCDTDFRTTEGDKPQIVQVNIGPLTQQERKWIQSGRNKWWKNFFVGPFISMGQQMYRPDNAWEAYGMQLEQLVGTMGFMGMNAMEFPAEAGYASLIDEEAEIHILYGDAPGSGGHAPGLGIPGKSEFPVGWTNEDILTAISDVATDPTSRATIQGNTTIIDGTRLDVVEGKYVDIRVVVRDGRIVTGYPTNVPRNP